MLRYSFTSLAHVRKIASRAQPALARRISGRSFQPIPLKVTKLSRSRGAVPVPRFPLARGTSQFQSFRCRRNFATESRQTAPVTEVAKAADTEDSVVPVEGSGHDDAPSTTSKKPSLWKRFKREVYHYYNGTRLLIMDVGTAWGLLKRVLYGHGLTRRERKQLMRTVTDVLRLVPFSVFIIIPFMEFLLPVALRFFPGMLPSTYTSELEQQERLKRNLKARLEMASFLQNTLETMARGAAKGDEDEVPKIEQIMDIIAAAREGRYVDSDDVLKLAKLFKDQVTLENMPRAQLVQLCKYMGISAFGSDTVLRIQLRMRVRAIKSDDRDIMWEGVSNLTLRELQLACQERGMRSTGLTRDGYERQLNEWLQLRCVPDHYCDSDL